MLGKDTEVDVEAEVEVENEIKREKEHVNVVLRKPHVEHVNMTASSWRQTLTWKAQTSYLGTG